MVFAQSLRCLANLAFAGQKHQNIALANPSQFVHRINNALVQIALTLALIRLNWPITNLNRIGASADIDDRRGFAVVREMLGKTFRINRRRGDNKLEIGTFGQNLTQIAEQKVNVQTALVRFVNDDRIVLAQQSISLRLRQQNPIGHELDRRPLVQTISETNFVADHFAQV